jgi:hypothetical protein
MVSERASQQAFFWRLGAALRCQRGGNDRLVRVHVGDGRDADARWLDDVDGVDADARTHVDSRGGMVAIDLIFDRDRLRRSCRSR